MKITTKEDAVSPVVGVMLMLVVTIIIAAVVTTFAGGLATETQATPNAVLAVDDYVLTKYGGSYESGDETIYYTNYDLTDIVISSLSGDTLSTDDLSIVLEKGLASKTYQFGELLTGAKSFGPGDWIELHKDKMYGLVDQSVSDGTTIKWNIIYTPTGQSISSGSFVVSTNNAKIIEE